MEDTQIISLYWARDEEAIPASDEKYAGCAAPCPGTSWTAPKCPKAGGGTVHSAAPFSCPAASLPIPLIGVII